MRPYYDSENKRIVHLGQKSDSNYWDGHWEQGELERQIKVKDHHFVINNTKKYLPLGSKILEGGSGRGDKVYSLQHHGYDATGVDYAKETVKKIKEIVPELNITLGDVRKLDFANDHFDGYWSLGVIEHFFNGYQEIATEMYRVLKKDGYLFMTVPSMSPLRRLKSTIKQYPPFASSQEAEDQFYQFLLPHEGIIKDFEEIGFKLVQHHPYDGVKGLKDEVSFLGPLLQKCYESRSPIIKVFRKLIDITFRKFSNHMSFYVFQKK
jgi:SAM-dependent methyltransferase